MHYIGIDAHKDNLVIQHMDEDGDLGITEEISATKEDILQFLDSLDFEASITLEAGKNYWWLHNLFSEHSKVLRVNVVDARRSRNLSKELSSMSGYGRAKNDRIDAEMMAEQDRRGLAPKIIVPTIQELEIRTLCRHRMDLVVQRTRIVNKTHAILSMHGISINFSELIDNIDSQQKTLSQLPGFVQIVVKSYLELFVCIRNEIQEFEKILQDKLPSSDPQIRLIQTAPGFGEILARVVHTEIRDICRFKCHGSLIN
jgi:transposase